MKRLIGSGPRYSMVGALFALLNAMMLILFDSVGLHYVLALLVSAITLIPLSYWMHLHFTYGVEARIGSFLRYCGTQMISMPLSLVVIFLVHDVGDLAMVWTAWIALGLMYIYNFLSTYWAVGSRRNLEGGML